MLSSQIRSSFLNFFKNNDHKIIESSSVVPQNDPSLLFANAGMVQFKNVFTGLETRQYKRVATSQKCIRAGGKHNDLEQVGFTARHNTFFEMLGNFSFGDYFKEEAICFAWTFLTKELGLPKEKLSVTVYHTDEEAKSIWRKVAGDIRIISISTSDNFWTMGDVGPCGPCSEIFYDHGEGVPGGIPGSPDEDGPRFMEIWNVVFMQFEQKPNGEKIPLAKKSIDTGLGLERVAGVLQGVLDNFQIDLFKGIIDEIKAISKTNFEDIYPSYKVIADHIRSVAILIADGILPSNEGRGYVLRRILRRAMRHGNLINLKDPFLYKLSDTFIDSMQGAYPELEKNRAMIASTIHREEEKFLSALDRGLKILQDYVKEIKVSTEPTISENFLGQRDVGSEDITRVLQVPSTGSTTKRPDRGRFCVLDGEKAFKLYDTYGFPLDLTQDILKADNISVDIAGFDAALQEQKNRTKWGGSGEAKEAQIWFDLKEKIKSVEFVGYEKEKCENEILAIVQDEKEVSSISSGSAFLIVKETPFYAESGGQCGDSGVIKSEGGVFKVLNAKKFCDGIIAHEGEILSGHFKTSDRIELQIDSERRRKIKANHTSAHLLQAALRFVLGEHVAQRGSFLNEDRLRFDFSHASAVSNEEIEQIEAIVNEWILQDLNVVCKIMTKSEAISAGATALFGEKYGDFVRTVSVFNENESRTSFELCGGTHVASTGRIGLFKIISEAGIASGIRRIEAISGEKVLARLKQTEEVVDSLAEKLKCGSADLLKKVDDLLAELKQKNREISSGKQKAALEKIQEFSRSSATIYSLTVSYCEMDELRSLNEAIKSKKPSGVIVVANYSEDKVSLIVSLSLDLQKKYNAGQLLKAGLAPLNGKGGGSAAFAQGGGVGKDKIPAAIEAIKNAID